MSLKKGQRVRHPIQVEWGLGEVLQILVKTNEYFS